MCITFGRSLRVVVACTIATMAPTAALAGPANASTSQRGGARADAPGQHHARRVGGTVRHAWPRTGKAPRTREARWLAHQVGAIEPRSCARLRRKAAQRCHLRRVSAATAMNAAGGDPGSPPGASARIATLVSAAVPIALPLQLVRAYQIPADDPAYHRLLNWSWTYDSAVTAAAFASTGDKANATQLLDQLAALQFTDGSLDIAFNTVTGEGAPVFRSGTVAWLGLAAATYDQAFSSSRYVDAEQRAADYLLSLQTASGLIRGGPDVEWVSTQHNLIAYAFLSRLAGELQSAGNAPSASRYQTAATTISSAIDANLLVSDAAGARFRQGLGDETQALDVQALGAMYLQGIGQPAVAAQVLAWAQSTFAVAKRSIVLSADTDTYNMTYASAGPFSGYRAYVGTGTPSVRWAEASGEMRLATAALGLDTGALDTSIAGWAAITKDAGALQADQTVKNDLEGVEYHVWPAASATAWTALAVSAPSFFAAPLPAATTLVTNWTKIRGGNLFTTSPDGHVSLMTGSGERRFIATSTAADYTVTANATLTSGAGYGIYVRATADAGTKTTAYCIQVDHGYGTTGQLVVRQIIGDVELGVPIAHVLMPAGFVWYGVPHTVGVTTRGNTMNITLDGAQHLNVPDLAAASAFSVAYAYPQGPALSAPAAGGYGMRVWGDAVAGLQQMTVGPAG
jgi:hypothetical protein